MTVSALPAVRRVAILGSNRIPFARSNTAYATASNQDMLTFALQGLIDRYDLHGLRLGEVAAGAVIKHSRDFNLTREALLSTTLARETPAYDVSQACGTGLGPRYWSRTRSRSDRSMRALREAWIRHPTRLLA